MSVLIGAWDIASLRRDASSGPAFTPNAGTNFPWDSLDFDKDSQEHVYGYGVLPQAPVYNGGTIKARIKWRTDASSTGTARWRFAIRGIAHGETFDDTFTDTADVDSQRTAANQELWADIELSSPSLAPGDTFVFKASRVADHANDNYGADAKMVAVELYAE